MYALANIEKFLTDHAAAIGEHAPGILKRARQAARNGLISGHRISAIMGDDKLAKSFQDIATSDPSHIKIAFSSIREGVTQHGAKQ